MVWRFEVDAGLSCWRRVTRPRSRRSRAWRSMGGGKRTWRVVRSARCGGVSVFSGLLRGSWSGLALCAVDGVEVRLLMAEVRSCWGVGRVDGLFILMGVMV